VLTQQGNNQRITDTLLKNAFHWSLQRKRGGGRHILNPLWKIRGWADYCGNARKKINDRIRLWLWWSEGGNKYKK
jgi:hypothetical protein